MEERARETRARHERRVRWAFAVVAVPLLLQVGCSGPHSTRDGDVDADADGDAELDADGRDADGTDEDALPDADEDEDGDLGPPGRTWVSSVPPLTGIAPLPGGELVVAWGEGVARLDPFGEVVWSKRYGGGDYWRFTVATSAAGRIFASAHEYAGPERTGWVAELGEDGTVLREQGIGPQVDGLLMASLDDGSFFAAVFDADGEPELMLVSPEEGVLWRQRVTRSLAAYDFPGLVVSDGHLFAVATYPDRGGTVVSSFDPEGGLRWSRSVGSVYDAAAASGDGGIVLGGVAGTRVLELDEDGELVWSIGVGRSEDAYTCYPYCEDDDARGVAVAADGRVLAVGQTKGRDGTGPYMDMLAVLFDADGVVLRQAVIRAEDRRAQTIAWFGALLDDGRWAVYGEAGTDHEPWLSMLTAEGALDRPCSAVGELALEPWSSVPEVEVVDDLILEEGTTELAEVHLEAEDAAFEIGAVCQ